jgi:hypothetical protein
MNAEELLRKMRSGKSSDPRHSAKHRIMSLVMLILASLCAVYAYEQRLKADAQRNEVIKLHRQIQELTDQSEALKLEASKLRMMMENREKDLNKKIETLESTRKK